MRFGWTAILGLALAVTAPAEAARSTQSSAPSSAPSSAQSAAPTAARSSGRVPQTRPAIQAVQPPRGLTRVNAVSGRGYANPGQASGRRTAQRNPTSRQVAPYHRAAAPAAQVRDRSGRLAMAPGYQRTVLRGQTASVACHTSRGRRVCGGTRQVAMRWSGGLSPAAGNQSSCPDGTMATLALGHDNVVRCVPL